MRRLPERSGHLFEFLKFSSSVPTAAPARLSIYGQDLRACTRAMTHVLVILGRRSRSSDARIPDGESRMSILNGLRSSIREIALLCALDSTPDIVANDSLDLSRWAKVF